MRSTVSRRAGPLFGLWLLVVGMILAVSPMIPSAQAIDPTPAPPTSAPDASIVPDATPTADPTVAPDPTIAPDPTVDPTVAPDPTATPDPTPTPDPSVAPSADPSAAPSATPDPTATPAPARGIKVTHYWIDLENDAGTVASAGAIDDPRIGMTRFTVYRVRFQVLNDGTTDEVVRPTLFAGPGATPSTWTKLATVEPDSGEPFYAASDKGIGWQVRTSPIKIGALKLAEGNAHAGVAVAGIFSAGVNPASDVILPAGSYTEIEFLVRPTVDAQWETAYGFRLDLAGSDVTARKDAVGSLGAAPPVVLSPGQSGGTPVEDDAQIKILRPATAGILARLGTTSPLLPIKPMLGAGSYISPHVYDLNVLTSDMCATCHAAHTAQGPVLLTAISPVATTCFQCHDGSGAVANTKAQYTSPTLPANVAATRSYYSHESLAQSTHVLDQQDEFAGVSNRHAGCADCHQPHKADATKPVQSASGWTKNGATGGASGVSVVNGVASSTPTFTWTAEPTLEYQLCFKCHSGFTTMPSNTGFPRSQWLLDKSVELNPANTSFHPIEAQGTNQTAKLGANLAITATAPGKIWAFTTTSTIRCSNCHGPSSASSPAVDSQIDVHASNNRGILLRNYTDRLLKLGSASYSATDFSLCYLCHGEAAYTDTSGNTRSDTNFREHGFHVAGIAAGAILNETVASIDTDGAGRGNALCAECHFRIHGTTSGNQGNDATTVNTRLVNFAPNVALNPSTGTIRFVQRVGATQGTCTLLCHGFTHTNEGY